METFNIQFKNGFSVLHMQGMYAVESVHLPSFRRYIEDMYYNHMPSSFPIHTAYAEVSVWRYMGNIFFSPMGTFYH